MPQKGQTEKGSKYKTSDFRRPFCATAYCSFFRLCLLPCFLFNVVAVVVLSVSQWKQRRAGHKFHRGSNSGDMTCPYKKSSVSPFHRSFVLRRSRRYARYSRNICVRLLERSFRNASPSI
jgi:hypothetical protein